MTDEVRRYLDKADHALEVAEELLKDGHVPDAASKTYYAMYYAAQALLNAEGEGESQLCRIFCLVGYWTDDLSKNLEPTWS